MSKACLTVIIFKMGGSVITDKSKYCTENRDAILRIVEEICSINEKMAVVHGGGSFGHIAAAKYDLKGKIDAKRARGISIVKSDMEKLNSIVVRAFIDAGMNAVGISPFFTEHMNTDEFLNEMVNDGQIPIMYGDVTVKNGEVKIVSGDDIIISASEILKPEKAIIFSDVDGIFDKDPKKHNDARIIKKLETHDVSFSDVENDVTGGMRKKYSSMIALKNMGVKTYLINGNYPERMHDIGKDEFIGTEIV
ncbi:isopentenyl phosphate kinase [Caldiplasma sukawensis]